MMNIGILGYGEIGKALCKIYKKHKIEPTIKDLNSYAYGRYVVSPHAKFINNEFVVLDMNTEGLPPFITDEEIAQRQAAYDAANNA